jgi:hypothetical protein
MIDLERDGVMSFRQAADWLPRRHRGRKVAITTLWRWSKYGVKGVKLETTRVGRTHVTSREALQRFCDRLKDVDTAGNEDRRFDVRQQNKHNADNAALDQELSDSGW